MNAIPPSSPNQADRAADIFGPLKRCHIVFESHDRSKVKIWSVDFDQAFGSGASALMAAVHPPMRVASLISEAIALDSPLHPNGSPIQLEPASCQRGIAAGCGTVEHPRHGVAGWCVIHAATSTGSHRRWTSQECVAFLDAQMDKHFPSAHASPIMAVPKGHSWSGHRPVHERHLAQTWQAGSALAEAKAIEAAAGPASKANTGRPAGL